ncbi:hypothetical protein BDW42DRAFT_166404 [Aspergillus taichungensis]|uniref:Uncharacterized protein n=1 Tax=Aspergillus taichungensis TaxID=482145 RepID=A0A2J5HYY3_9EURO|nr:hypothetical protein BDW42DRAFT_166404 [Aspergillus taichungensis]
MIYIYNVRRKKVLPSDQSEHQGGVDAALLKAVGFNLPRTNDKNKGMPRDHCQI